MKYREFLPAPPLQSVVDCIWTLEGHAADLDAPAQPILPDGRSELIVHLGDPFERIDTSGTTSFQPLQLFAGQLTSQLVLRPTGRIAAVGIRFHADGAPSLTRIPQERLAGLTVDAAEVAPLLARELARMSDAAVTPFDAAVKMQELLCPYAIAHRVDAQIRCVVEIIIRRHGQVSIERLAAHAGVSRRHLERRFRERVGLSPKRLARIVRFQHTLRHLEEADTANRGAATAAACGFADQAHFIRDFRQLAGCAPGEHLLRQAELTGFFLDGSR